MPNVSKKTKNYKKRYMSKRKRFYKKNTLPFKSQTIVKTGFPRTTVVKLKYVDGFGLDPSAIGLASTFVFRANSIQDPSFSSAGHQPMNRDLWSQLYKRYTVIGARCNLRVFHGTTSNSYGILAGVVLNEDSNLADLNPSTLMEQGLVRYVMANATNTAGSGRGMSVSKNFSAKKFFNVANVSDNKDLGANQSDNPVRTCKFICIVSPTPNSGIDLAQVHCVVTIEYLVLFSEPLEQPAS